MTTTTCNTSVSPRFTELVDRLTGQHRPRLERATRLDGLQETFEKTRAKFTEEATAW